MGKYCLYYTKKYGNTKYNFILIEKESSNFYTFYVYADINSEVTLKDIKVFIIIINLVNTHNVISIA